MERTFGPAKGMSHTQACRARVEKEIEDDPCKRGKLEEDRKRAEERDRALPEDKRHKKLRFTENPEIVEIPPRDCSMTGHPAGSSSDREYPKAEPHPKRNRVEPEQSKPNLKRDRPEDGEKPETQAARPLRVYRYQKP